MASLGVMFITLLCTLLLGILVYVYSKLVTFKKLISEKEQELLNQTQVQKTLMTELGVLKEKLLHEVLYDSLTQLPGRQVFEDRLEQILNQSERFQLTFGVLFIDLDRFKVVNNVFGYEIGDEVLKEVAQRLQTVVRQIDTVSRFSSDEFVVIAAQLAKPESAAYVAQRILNAIAQPFKIKDQELFITASIGISLFPVDGNKATTILKNANNALTQAKAQRNSYQFFRSEMHALSRRELMLSTSLQDPDLYSQLRIHYQPQIDVVKKQITYMHAILSWQHPEFGLLSWNDFLHSAENNGKIIEIGEWLIRSVIQQYIQWQKTNILIDGIAISVSPRQLENSHFAYKVSQLFQELKVSPACLSMEVPETSLVARLDIIEKVFHMLKHVGVRITIKEFGLGQLSLQHLKRFPIDSLKIATSLVRGLTIEKENESIIRMAIALANSLQITIAADGVENLQQTQLLKELGCYILQGNFFSKPFSSAELTMAKLGSLLN